MTNPAISPDINKQLFLDDHAVEQTSRVVRTLHQPEKVGPVIRLEHRPPLRPHCSCRE